MSLQTSKIIVTSTNLFAESTVRVLVDLLWSLIRKIDVLIVPVPREVTESLVRYSLSGIAFSDAIELLQDTVLRSVYHRGAWVRVLIPLLELLYSAVRLKPELEVKSLETLSDLYATDLVTIDLVKFVLRKSIDSEIAAYIYEKLTSQVSRTLREMTDRLSDLLEEGARVCIMSTSCIVCVSARELFPESDLISVCVSAPPPMQLMTQLALTGKLTVSIIEKLYPYLRKYILEYVVTSSFLSEAYMRFTRENRNYVDLAHELLKLAKPCRGG